MIVKCVIYVVIEKQIRKFWDLKDKTGSCSRVSLTWHLAYMLQFKWQPPPKKRVNTEKYSQVQCVVFGWINHIKTRSLRVYAPCESRDFAAVEDDAGFYLQVYCCRHKQLQLKEERGERRDKSQSQDFFIAAFFPQSKAQSKAKTFPLLLRFPSGKNRNNTVS